MRWVIWVVVWAEAAAAQPAPAPAPPPPPVMESSVELRAGLGIGRYSEDQYPLEFTADIQPFTQLSGEAVIATGRGGVVVQAGAGLGFQADMRATQNGQLTQTNTFKQEIYDASVRYRHLRSARFFVEVGYRFTLQRLHFRDLRDPQGNPGLISGANEDAFIHALEGGFGWRRTDGSGHRRELTIVVGLNRGTAENDQVEGEEFSAIGLSLGTRALYRWPFGLQLGGEWSWRREGGSDQQVVTVMGMQTTAIWPGNTTWTLLGLVGFGF